MCMSENLEDPAYLELVEKLKHDELLVSFNGYWLRSEPTIAFLCRYQGSYLGSYFRSSFLGYSYSHCDLRLIGLEFCIIDLRFF